MKKLMILVLVVSIVNVIVLLLILCGYSFNGVESNVFFNECDTTINKLRIDSIEYNIKVKDSIINKIKIEEQYEIIKVDGLSDTASVELFKRLVSE